MPARMGEVVIAFVQSGVETHRLIRWASSRMLRSLRQASSCAGSRGSVAGEGFEEGFEDGWLALFAAAA